MQLRVRRPGERLCGALATTLGERSPGAAEPADRTQTSLQPPSDKDPCGNSGVTGMNSQTPGLVVGSGAVTPRHRSYLRVLTAGRNQESSTEHNSREQPCDL